MKRSRHTLPPLDRRTLAGVIAASIFLSGLSLLVFQQLEKHFDNAVHVGRDLIERQSRIVFAKSDLAPAIRPIGERVPSMGRILSVLSTSDRFLVGATDGLHLYDKQGGNHHLVTRQEGRPPGDIPRMVNHDGTPVLAVSGQGLIFYSRRPEIVKAADSRFGDPTDLLSTPQGDLWIGTRQGGLLRWRNQHLEHAFTGKIHDSHVTALAGSSVDLWIGTYSEGLARYFGGTWSYLGRPEGLPDSQITALALDSRDALYVGTPLGLARIQGGRVAGLKLKGEFIISIVPLDGHVFASTLSGKCYRFDSNFSPQAISPPWTFQISPQSPPIRFHASGTDLLVSNGPQLWRAVSPSSRLRWLDFIDITPTETPVLSARNISSLATDSDGRLWVGYFENGLDVVDWVRRKATHQRNEIMFCINHIHSDRKSGMTYVSTANGLGIFNSPSEYRVLRKKDGLLHNNVSEALPETPGSQVLYLATAGGLSIVSPEGVRSLYAFHGLPSNHIFSLAPFRRGVILGTLSGLSYVSDAEPPRNFSSDNSEMRHNWVNAVLSVGQDVWLGTYGGGVQILKGGNQWRDVAEQLSQLHINPTALFLHKQWVFAGSLEAGLFVIDVNTLEWSQILNPLPSRNVTSFAVDDQFLYVGTDRGLVRFSRGEIENLQFNDAQK